MAAIAGIDDMNVILPGGGQMLGHEIGCAAGCMANDKHVRLHGGQIVGGIEQRFALAGRRCIDVEIDDIGRQAFGGDFKRRARAG